MAKQKKITQKDAKSLAVAYDSYLEYRIDNKDYSRAHCWAGILHDIQELTGVVLVNDLPSEIEYLYAKKNGG